jgi:DNA-binding response OmpR family regulator
MALLSFDDGQKSHMERVRLPDPHARPKPHIVVVDADDGGRALVSGVLTRAGYDVTGLHDGEMLLPLLREHDVDLLILEVELPGMDGFALCQTIRAVSDVLIIFLSAHSEAADRIAGLHLGADDYLAKPIEPSELQARVAAVLRRGKRTQGVGERLHVRALLLESLHASVLRADGKRINLIRTEFRLLFELARHSGCVLSIEHILSAVWGNTAISNRNLVALYVRRLRTKLERDAANPYISSTKGGYIFLTEAGRA